MAKKGGKNDKKGSAEKVKNTRKLYNLYEVKGDELIRKNQFSPKSPGDFLANHKTRKTCGKTQYTEFISKVSKESKEE